MAPNSIAHLVILGLMGSGKTSVGRLVAGRLRWPLDDSDEAIEREHGATVRELASRIGVDAMHELEAEHLLVALSRHEPSVVAAAASVIDDARCRAELGRPDVYAVWLDVDLATLVSRFSAKSHRPLLASTPRAMFEQEIAARRPLFAEVADLRVREHGRRRPAQSATEILSRLGAG